jgi:hypothetical protein
MPTLNEALSASTEGYVQVKSQMQPNQPAVTPSNEMQPGYNTMIRCPLPPIFQATPDSLNQYYLNSKVPQTRFLSPLNNVSNNSGGSTGGNSAVIFSGNGGGVIPPPVQPTAQQAVITTNVMGPGQQFVTSFQNIGQSFQLLSVASSVAARFQMYGTASAQMSDLSRALDQPPPAGTAQGIITDVALDASPFTWSFQNRIGANGDNPQNPTGYVTITNISEAAVPITVTLQYVPIES